MDAGKILLVFIAILLSPFAMGFGLLVIASLIAFWPVTIVLAIIFILAWMSGQQNIARQNGTKKPSKRTIIDRDWRDE